MGAPKRITRGLIRSGTEKVGTVVQNTRTPYACPSREAEGWERAGSAKAWGTLTGLGSQNGSESRGARDLAGFRGSVGASRGTHSRWGGGAVNRPSGRETRSGS